MKLYRVYTDGACSGNPGPGGWGVVIVHNNQIDKLDGNDPQTTNNRMELLAVIIALEKIKIKNSNVTIFTDSKYVSDAVEKGWVFDWEKKNFKNKKNPDLWMRFLNIYNEHKIKFHWVKGHSNDFYNDRCDLLANNAAKSLNLIEDSGYNN